MRNRVCPAVAAMLAASIPCLAQLKAAPGDWPAWRGPDRTGVSAETGLLDAWPAGGPKLAWRTTEIGRGYSMPSIVAGTLYLLGTGEGETECLLAVSAKDGSVLWRTPFGRTQGGYPGPRSTPTFDEGLLYVLSSDGKLLCADARTGAKKWTKDLVADFGGKCGGWAYAESPLIDGAKVVCTPGGETSTMVALDRKTGAKLWTCGVKKERAPAAAPTGGGDRGGRRRPAKPYAVAGYSSIVAADICGVRQYVQFLDGGVIGVAAADGKLLWTYDAPASPTANCTTPVVRGDIVFAASAYNTGGGAARISKTPSGFEAKEIWFLKDFQNHHGGVVLVGDHLYGTGASQLLCVELNTGTVAWRAPSVGKGSVVAAGGRLYVRSENGPIALADASPAAYTERGRFDQPDRRKEKSWPHILVAGGRMYVRDQDLLLCYDVAK